MVNVGTLPLSKQQRSGRTLRSERAGRCSPSPEATVLRRDTVHRSKDKSCERPARIRPGVERGRANRGMAGTLADLLPARVGTRPIEERDPVAIDRGAAACRPDRGACAVVQVGKVPGTYREWVWRRPWPPCLPSASPPRRRRSAVVILRSWSSSSPHRASSPLPQAELAIAHAIRNPPKP